MEAALFWIRARRPDRVRSVRAQRATLSAHQVFLASLDGREAVARIRTHARVALTADDALELALVPAMRHGDRPMWDLLEELASLAASLPPDWVPTVMGTMGALGYDELTPAERPRLLEVLRRMPFPQTLFTDLEKRGEERGAKRGALHQARESLLEDFTVLFGSVPPVVEQRARQTEDIDQLKAWRRAILKAGNPAAAERAIVQN